MQNELATTFNTQNPQTNQMASQGRKGDTMVAHVTPGDYVIPKDILVAHPEFLVKLKKVMEDAGEDYRTHMVGSGFENINPGTDAPEFGFGKAFKSITRGIGNVVGSTAAKVLPDQISDPLGRTAGSLSPAFGPLGSSYVKGYGEGMEYGNKPRNMQSSNQPYSPTEMNLPGSLQELGGLTDIQRRSYLASQGAQGEGLGGSSRDYYINLLQRNIQNNQDANLLPVESQYLTQGGINPNLSGQALIDALRGF